MKSKLTRRILATLLVLAMLLTLVPAAFAASFSDVPAGSWYDEAVTYCEDNGIMSGVGEGKFDPFGKVTREQGVQALYALDGSEEVAYEPLFSDVLEGKWFAPAVIWGAKNNIVAGLEDGTFGIFQNVTREQMASFFYRYAAYVGADVTIEDDLSSFPDKADTHKWALDAVEWAVAAGIISGKRQDDGSILLKPTDELMRAELAVMMMKFHQFINAKEDLTGKTVILHTNDVHGAIAGYAYIAGLKADFEAKGAEVILADAGDYSQGTTNVSLSKGANAIDLMNLVGYDVATLGNHEFDYGADQLFANLEKADFAVTCADVLKDGEAIYDPYVIIEKGGVKIAFIGLETPEAQTKANPALIQGLSFLSNDTDPAIWAETQAQVDAAKAAGADLVIGLVHLGVDGESVPYRSVDMLQEVTGFDFVIDGHSHTVMECGPQGEPIQSTGTAFANIGCIVIDNETNAIEDNYLIPITEESPADPEVTAAAQEIIDAIAAEYGTKFAVSEVDLNGDKAPNGNRDSETNNGDFITDAMIWSVTEQNPGSITGVPAENIVAITNGGGIRAWIHKGDVTKNDILTVLPFGNTVAVVYVTGAELLEALEASTYCTPEAVGGFPQIAGMNITIDTSKAYDANETTYPGSTYYGPASINRVTIDDVNGQPFDPTATYAVVTNNFCAAGGDTYYAFAAASSQFDTGRPLDEVVMDYVTEKLEGVIPASLYEEPQGRITIKTEADEEGIKGLVIPDGADMLKYGHIDIDIPADEFLKEFSLGDTVLVDIEGYGTYEVPVCASYDDVAAGEMLLRVVSGKTYLILAINYGQIAVQEGLVELAPEGSATKYVVKEGVTFPINVTITKKITQVKSVVIPDGTDMLKYGHIDIDYPADDFLTEFELGDIVTVELEGYGTYEVPVCASYDDVAAGEMLLRVVSGKTYLILAINYGQIAVQEGLVELAPEGSATKYVVKDGVTFPINVTITLKGKADPNILGNLVRTENREEYPELTDAEFANFREVTAGNIRPETLYRSSSPINPEIGRNTYADAAAAEAGVKTFINLADTEAEAAAYPGYAESYYSAQNHIFLGLPVAFTTDTFKSGLAEGFRYIINNEAPYLVHCTEGKDRAGLTAAILECLCGATYEEVLDDYVTTYHNYYSVEDGAQRALTDKEIAAIGDVILANLKLAFGVEITETTDLAAAAEAYMTSIGLTDEEIEQLKIALCGYDEPIRDGDKIAIVLNSNNKAVSTTAYFYEAKGYWQLTPVDVTVEDGIVAYQDGITFEVMHDMDRCYQFIADGKYLTSGETGNNLTLEETPTEYSSWILEETDGGWFIKNKAAQYNGNPQYLEFYNSFTVYGKAANANPENYAFSFYPVAGAPAAEYEGKTVILHSNDVHGAIAGYAYIAGLKADFEAKGAEVILADAGDYSQGTTNVSLSKGANAVDMMNLVGYDVATLGNHEFDYGADQLFANLEKADFAVTCADVLKDGEAIYDPYVIIEKDGVKVAFIGLETPEAQTKANPALIQGLTFLTNETDPTLWANTQAQVDAAKAAGADIVVALAHLGVDESSRPYTSLDLLGAVEGIDFIIDGHSHTVMSVGADGEPIQSTGTAFEKVGCIVIDNESKKIVDNYLITVDENTPKDETVAAAAQAIIDEIAEEYDKKFAESLVDLNGAKAPNGNRDSETNNGDLITDAMIWCVTEQYPGSIAEVPAENIVAITNGGGIRAAISKGDVTKNDIFTVLPFGNTVAVVYVTGAELLEALEASTYCTPVSLGGFPQVAGIKFSIDLNKDYDANAETYPGSTYYGPASINRVTITEVNGKAFDPAAKYAVVTNNFCAGGGDTYYAFAAASSQFDTGYTLDAVVMDYITEKLGGVIGEDYADPQGRITIIPKEPVEWDRKVTIGGTTLNQWFTKYGNTYCDCTEAHFTGTDDNGFGFKEGDIVTVKFLDQEIDLPVGTNYSDVDSGTPMIKINAGGYIEFAINMGNFGSTYGLVDIVKDPETGTYTITPKEGVTFPVEITFELKEAQGYAAELAMHRLVRTNNREDYADLSDAEFANFRQVTTTGMGDHLYRGSSPINPEIGRNGYADAAIEDAGVTVILNLADSQAIAEGYEGFADTYYAGQNVKYLNLGVDFTADDFKAGLADGLRFFAENEGTYYIHCTEGKDRAGFVNALLECLMGATYEEVVADYMVTYYNYYGVTTDDERYEPIAKSNIIKTLCTAFGVEDLATADLAAEAAEYIKGIGLSDDELAALIKNLGDEPIIPDPPTPPTETVAIFYPTDSKVMTTESYFYNNKKYELAAADATLTDGIISTEADNVALFTMIEDGETVTFKTEDGKYLSADGTNVALVDAEDDNTKFVLEEADGGVYIRCATAQYQGKAQYLEYYSNYFTVYGFNESNKGIYTFVLAPVAARCDHEWEKTDEVAATCTEAGSITYTCSLCGKTKSESVSALGHDIVDGACTRCDYVVPVVPGGYVLVTDAADLADGDVFVFGATKDGTTYGSGDISGKFLGSVTATLTDGVLSGDGLVEITLKETTGGWYLKIGDKYINTTAAKALTFGATASTVWTISIADGLATVAAGDYGRFLYNVNSPRFLNYTSATNASMLLPSIYKAA